MKTTEKWWFWMMLCFLLYANTLKHSYAIDDTIVVTGNKLTQQGIEGISEIFSHSYLYGYDGREDESYRPITLMTFALERSFFDANPSTSHLIQVLLYGVCVTVIFRFLTELFTQEKKNLALVISLLFAVHPLHTEVVANVKSRDELLSALFLFSALLFYLNYLKHGAQKRIYFSLIFFFLAMLSKETSVMGIMLFPALSYFVKGGSVKEIARQNMLFVSPFIFYFGIRAIVLSDVLIKDPIDPVANSLVLADNGWEQFASNASIFAKYMQLSVLPINMSWDYSVAQLPLHSLGSLSALVGVICIVCILFLLVYGMIKKELYGFGALIFVSTFVLTSNFFFLINCPLGERFMFMPVLGMIIFIVLLLSRFERIFNKTIQLTLFAIFGLYFTGRTVVRNTDWKDNLHIYEAGAIVCPKSVKVQFNLATEYLQQGEKAIGTDNKNGWFIKAIDRFQKAQGIFPQYSLIYENMGFVYSELGKLAVTNEEKKVFFKDGLKELNKGIDSLHFEKQNLYQNKYFVLEQLIELANDRDEKKKYLDEMLRTVEQKKEKNDLDLLRQAFYLKMADRHPEVLTVASQLVTKYPDRMSYLLELSEEYFKKNKFKESYELISLYVSKNPDDLSAKSNKGMLQEILGNKKEALRIYEEILAIDPNQAHTRELYSKLKGI